MLFIPPPVSNAERQRQFRERNPGYYGRLHAKRRGCLRVPMTATIAIAAPATRTPLMLPAPVEAIIIPGINTIPVAATPMPDRIAIPLNRSAA